MKFGNLVFFLFFSIFFYGQNEPLLINYSLKYKPNKDSIISNYKEESFYLYIDVEKQKSIFVSHSKKTSDSLLQNASNLRDLYKYKKLENNFSNVISYNYKDILLKEYDIFGSVLAFYSLNNFLINWTLSNDKDTYNGYKVKKATCNLFGREWIAWYFTDLLNLPEGPYKFKGLPGLIAKISDVNNEYVFSFNSLQKYNGKDKFYTISTSNLKEISFLKFNELKKQFSENVEQAIPDYNKMDDELKETMKEVFLSLKKSKNNPIELNQYVPQ